MFGNTLSYAETGLVTLIGMGTVFFVLVLLMVLLELFRFIPSGEVAEVSKTTPTTPTIQNSVVAIATIPDISVSSLHKAIMIAVISEDQGINTPKNQVRISRIRQLS